MCVPFCSWNTQVTSRCWKPFSQVAEQGLQGPATHLPRGTRDSERMIGRRGQLLRRALQSALEMVPEYGSGGSNLSSAAYLIQNFSVSNAPLAHEPLFPAGHSPGGGLLIPPVVSPHALFSGVSGHEAGRLPAEAQSVIMWFGFHSFCFLSPAMRTGPKTGKAPTAEPSNSMPRRYWGHLSLQQKLAGIAFDKRCPSDGLNTPGPGTPAFPPSGLWEDPAVEAVGLKVLT